MIMDASLHTLDIKSPAFVNGGLLPTVYRREGLNMNPGLKVQFIPSETRSLAVVLKDVDAPVSPRVHWVCWDIPVCEWIRLNENRGINGVNDFQLSSYTGPCVMNSRHKYFFYIYALNVRLCLPASSPSYRFFKLIQPHVLASGSLLFFSITD